MCVCTIKVCAPTSMDSRRRVGEPVGGLGVGVVGRLEGLHCKVGDAQSRWSHMWGSWYFPRFLLRVGSCTWMNMASLMVLEWLLTSLWTMLNCFGSIGYPVVVLWRWMGEGAWNVPWLFHPVIYLTHLCRHWGNLFGGIDSGIWCLFGCFGVLVLGVS